MISKLPQRSVTPRQDEHITSTLITKAGEKAVALELYPNAWMRPFGVQEGKEVVEHNEHILRWLRDYEESSRAKRKKKGLKVKGARSLSQEALDIKRYSPFKKKLKEVKIFVYALDKKLRQDMISSYDLFCEKCTKCYERWKIGDYSVLWPPGAFLPAMPPRMNCFES